MSLSVSTSASAATVAKNVLPEAARVVEGGRTLEILVPQAEIKSNINASNVSMYAGGGLLMALVDAKINSDRAKAAESDIQPLRAALAGFDADALAQSTTKAVVDANSWFQAQPVTFGRDNSPAGKLAALDAATTNQMAFFEYDYEISADFSYLKTTLVMTVADKAAPEGKKPAGRLDDKNLLYSQSVISIISLASPSKVATENAARWSADGGKLARQALGLGFDDLRSLGARSLALTLADTAAMSSRDKKLQSVAVIYAGRVVEETPTGTLYFNGGFIRTQTVGQ